MCSCTKYHQIAFPCSCANLLSYQQCMSAPVDVLSVCSPVLRMSKMIHLIVWVSL
uniref:Uncharacterized protein n=1 Tax=Sus scrofa TaxID=9823 RepID=A0A4X1VBM2_PIG